MLEFLREWVLTYVALEGKLWTTLWAIFARPGHLTIEYLRGRRQRYVQPLRLLLTLGFLFFLSVRFGVSIDSEISVETTVIPETSVEAVADDHPNSPSGIWLPEGLAKLLPAHVQRQIDAVNTRARTDPETELRRLSQAMLGLAPYAVLLSIPVFACLLKLLFWYMPYGGHFVFALHLHAAWYGLMLLAVLTPWSWTGIILWIWIHLYPALALKRVHELSWPHSMGKSAVLGALHLLLITCSVIALVLAGVVVSG